MDCKDTLTVQQKDSKETSSLCPPAGPHILRCDCIPAAACYCSKLVRRVMRNPSAARSKHLAHLPYESACSRPAHTARLETLWTVIVTKSGLSAECAVFLHLYLVRAVSMLCDKIESCTGLGTAEELADLTLQAQLLSSSAPTLLGPLTLIDCQQTAAAHKSSLFSSKV